MLRTIISAFIAAYEINLQVNVRCTSANSYKLLLDAFLISFDLSNMQMEDGTLMLILDILCKIYQGEVWTWLLSTASVVLINRFFNPSCY